MERNISVEEKLAKLKGRLDHGDYISEKNSTRMFENAQEAAIILMEEIQDDKKHCKILRQFLGDWVNSSDRSRMARAAVISARLGLQPGDMTAGALREFFDIDKSNHKIAFDEAAFSLGGELPNGPQIRDAIDRRGLRKGKPSAESKRKNKSTGKKSKGKKSIRRSSAEKQARKVVETFDTKLVKLAITYHESPARFRKAMVTIPILIPGEKRAFLEILKSFVDK